MESSSLLIVEDEPELQNLLRDLLSPFCGKIVVAGNGREALELLGQNPPFSAILSDLSMPEMDGLELLANLRGSFDPIPFVILTGFGDFASLQEAIRLNATDFLSKPFHGDQLAEVVRRALAYGVELAKAELELDEFFRANSVPAERLTLLRRVKRTAMAMRIENSIYLKKIGNK